MLLPAFASPPAKAGLRFPDRELTYDELAREATAVAAALVGKRLVAVWARPTADTCVTIVGALLAGVPVVPINPKIGERERAHTLGDSDPDLVVDGDPPRAAPVALRVPDPGSGSLSPRMCAS